MGRVKNSARKRREQLERWGKIKFVSFCHQLKENDNTSTVTNVAAQATFQFCKSLVTCSRSFHFQMNASVSGFLDIVFIIDNLFSLVEAGICDWTWLQKWCVVWMKWMCEYFIFLPILCECFIYLCEGCKDFVIWSKTLIAKLLLYNSYLVLEHSLIYIPNKKRLCKKITIVLLKIYLILVL